MSYNKINQDIFLKIKNLLGSDNVFMEKDILSHYSHDETEDLSFCPELVVKPKTTKDISELMKICYDNNIPVTPRGAGTGLSGGALPVKGGVVLSVERMNDIIEIDTDNLQATVQPGVINQVFQDELKKHDLFSIKSAQKKATINVFKAKGIPFRTFEVLKKNEETLGELFTFFMLETILLGKMLKINPYNQPSVELIKKETKKILI